MNDEMSPVEQRAFLSRSKTRVGVLERLRADGATSAGPADPYAPTRKQTELLGAVDWFRGWLPLLDSEGTRVVHEQTAQLCTEPELEMAESADRLSSP